MGHNGASRHMQAFCCRGLRCLLHPLLPVPRRLSPHSFRVGLGRFPRSLSTQLRRRNAVYLCPVGRRLGSESHLIRSKLRSAILCSSQKQKPRKMLCGLGSWHEQQQAIELSQKTRLLHDKTTQYPAGFFTQFIAGCHTDAQTLTGGENGGQVGELGSIRLSTRQAGKPENYLRRHPRLLA